MSLSILKTVVLLFFVAVLFCAGFVLAENLAETCRIISESDDGCQGLSNADCKKRLEKCAAYYEAESEKIAVDLTKTEQEKNTLQNKVSTLKKRVQNLAYQINQGNVMVKDLGLQIGDTQLSIKKISLNIEESRDHLVGILRIIAEEDQKSSIEILLEGSFSDFFDNLVYLEDLNSRVRTVLENTKDLKAYLEGQKTKMDYEKADLERVVKVQILQKQDSEQAKSEQESYLRLTEAQYQKQFQEKQEVEGKAAKIRARIFELLGVAKAPTFGEAYSIAKYVSGTTGVRAALILAILTQESNMGKNVGQCYLKNTQTGSGIYIKTGNTAVKTMSPKRDVSYFLEVIEKINKGKGLARDPFETPVSCVMYSNGKPYGWGGAMGPSQFIPSTWAKAGYGDRVEKITGKIGDPWDIKDAFLATGLYLMDSGAANRNSEFKAVMNYFSGSSWTAWEEFYGRSVLSIAARYEKDIAALEAGS